MKKVSGILLSLLLVSCTTVSSPEPPINVFTEYCNKPDWMPFGDDACSFYIGDVELMLRVTYTQDDQGNSVFATGFAVGDFSVASQRMYDKGIAHLTDVLSKIVPNEEDMIIEAVIAQRIQCIDGEELDCSSGKMHIESFSYSFSHRLIVESDMLHVLVMFLED